MENSNQNPRQVIQKLLAMRLEVAKLLLAIALTTQPILAQVATSNNANGQFSTPATPSCGQDSPDSPMAPTLQQRHQDCVATLGPAVAERCFTFGTRAIPCTNPDGSSPLFTGSYFRLIAQSARGLNQVWLQTRYTYHPGSLGAGNARHTSSTQSDPSGQIAQNGRASVPAQSEPRTTAYAVSSSELRTTAYDGIRTTAYDGTRTTASVPVVRGSSAASNEANGRLSTATEGIQGIEAGVQNWSGARRDASASTNPYEQYGAGNRRPWSGLGLQPSTGAHAASNEANGRFSTPAQASVPPTLIVHTEQLLWTTLSDTPSSPIMAFHDGTPTSQEYCAQNIWGANVKQNLPIVFRLPTMGEVSTAVTGGLANINTQWINESFWTLDRLESETTYGYHGQIYNRMTATAAHILPPAAALGAPRMEAHHYTHRGFDTEPTRLPVVCVSDIAHF